MDNLWNYIDDRKLVLDISAVSHHVVCEICDGLLQNASFTTCGCRFCAKCITDYLSSDDIHFCPGCLKEGFSTDLSEGCEVVIDPVGNKEVAKLRLQCPHAGCSESVEMRAMLTHLSVCEYGAARNCLFSVVGCARAALTEDQINQHLREDQRRHDELVTKFLGGCRKSEAELRLQMLGMEEKLEELREKTENLEEKLWSGAEQSREWNKNLEELIIAFKEEKTKNSVKEETNIMMNEKIADIKVITDKIVDGLKKDEEIQTLEEELKAEMDLVKKKDGENTSIVGELTHEWKLCDMDAYKDKGERYGDQFDFGGYKIGLRVVHFSRYGWFFILTNLVLYPCDIATLEWPLRRDLWIGIVHPVTNDVVMEKKFGLRHSTDRKGDYNKPISRTILWDSDIIIRPICSISNWDRKSLILRCGMAPLDPL